MRGKDKDQTQMFSYVSLEDRIPKSHPIRRIRTLANQVLCTLDAEFDRIYSGTGRPSIPPEHLLRASLLQVLYGIRSEISLMEQVDYNLLFRWFIGLEMDDRVWTPETFSMNRDRLFTTEIMRKFFDAVVESARKKNLVSKEHFSVDGTLIQAWASQKSFRPKDENRNDDGDGGDFRGEKRSNETHASTTDPDARLCKKSAGDKSILAYTGHVIMENRNGIAVDCEMTTCSGTAEREAAKTMVNRLRSKRRRSKMTLGADKGYDTQDMVSHLQTCGIKAHIAVKARYGSNLISKRTISSLGYQMSIRCRKRIEQIFGWLKTTGGMRQTVFRGLERVGSRFTFAISVRNLLRISNSMA